MSKLRMIKGVSSSRPTCASESLHEFSKSSRNSFYISLYCSAIFFGAAALAMSTSGFAASPSFQLLQPKTLGSTTEQETLNFAARTDPGTTATVDDKPAEVFSTGVFVRDLIPLKPGDNAIHVAIGAPDGSSLTTDVAIRYEPGSSHAKESKVDAEFQARNAVPIDQLEVNPGEPVELGIPGAPHESVQVQWAGRWFDLAETTTTRDNVSDYRTTLRAVAAQATDSNAASPVIYRIASKDNEKSKTPPVMIQSRGHLLVRDPGAAPDLVEVKPNEKGQLAFGLTDVRLGGPYLYEVPAGTILNVNGRKGDYFRVALCPDYEVWVDASQVRPCAPGTPIPHLQFTSLSTSVTAEGDESVSIPYDSPVPFAVQDVANDGTGNHFDIHVDLFGAHAAATWLSHNGTGNIISMVTLEQVATDHLRVDLHLKAALLGYKAEVTSGALKVTVRHTPAINHDHPLQNLTIAIEAGHGGSNIGALGILGTQEKDITLAVSKVLQKELEAAGAKVVQCRTGDVYLPFTQKIQPAFDSNADLFVAIHCNSAGQGHGLLAAGGTSTYYKFPCNYELSDTVLKNVLHETGLHSFGNVGNFNYTPLRMISWMPAILVEQAFISNPREEALLRDPEFQKKMAHGIRLGLEEWAVKRTQNPL